jgi:hypothetical protein
MNGWSDSTRIEIATPDAAAAFALERRLAHFAPVTVGTAAGWSVEFADREDRSDQIEAIVREWLRAEHLEATTVRTGGHTRTVDRTPSAERLQIGLGLKP